MSASGSGQSSRTPFDHLRYYYPETWKKLVGMMEDKGAVTNLAGERRPEGLKLEGMSLTLQFERSILIPYTGKL